jgi:hypothetical protein
MVVDVSGFVPAQTPLPPPPPPPSTTTTTTTLPGGATTTTTTLPGTPTTPPTTVPATCPEQGIYDATLAMYNALPNPLLLSVLQQLDPDGDGNACN